MGTIKTTNIEPIADNGTVTLGSSGDTFTIPSGVTLANSGTATGLGITVAQQWRVTSNFNSTSGVVTVTSNWEAVDTYGQGTIGSAMSESSGVFTFPQTGIYHVSFQASAFMDGAARDYVGVFIYTTTDNASFNQAALAYDSAHTGNAYGNISTNFIFDVTNTSTHKVRFATQVPGSINFEGSSDTNKCFATFIRLGDT
jgi:hypothetical protein|tara:strand:- start:52 stop:648 length:597 start_codon:yes stop_codon:yes gene_type:complete